MAGVADGTVGNVLVTKTKAPTAKFEMGTVDDLGAMCMHLRGIVPECPAFAGSPGRRGRVNDFAGWFNLPHVNSGEGGMNSCVVAIDGSTHFPWESA